MAQPEKPHFSNPVLTAGMLARRTRLGAALLEPFNGCSAPNAVYAEWHPNVEADADKWIKLPGLDKTQAGRWSRNWRTAMLMSVPEEELDRLEDEVIDYVGTKEAVAFRSAGAVHVAVHPKDREMFGGIRAFEGGHYDGEWAAGMRRGRGPLEAAMGRWIPHEKVFVGTQVLHLVSESLDIQEFTPLSQSIPHVPLIV